MNLTFGARGGDLAARMTAISLPRYGAVAPAAIRLLEAGKRRIAVLAGLPQCAAAASGLGQRIALVLIALVTILPALRFAMLVKKYGVAVPKRDDWDVAMLIANAHRGSIHMADLLSQQQEGRTLIPKLTFILSTFTGRWDVRDLMWVSVAVCMLTVVGILCLLRQSGLSRRATVICLAIASALIFTPAQDEVIAFAFGFPSFLPALCIVAALVGLRAKISTGAKFALSAALAAASSFTLPQGLLALGITFPVLFIVERKSIGWKWAAGWLVVCAVCAAIYFNGYVKPNDQPPFAPSHSISDYTLFVVGFIGGAWARATQAHVATGAIVGSVLTAIYIVAITAISRASDAALRRNAAPWIALGLYSIGSALLAALGRIGYHVAYFLASRYVPFSIYVCIADAVLIALLLEQRKRSSSRAFAAVMCAALAAVVTLDALSSAHALHRLRFTSATDRLGRAALQLHRAIDTSRAIDRALYPGGGCVQHSAPLLDSFGLFRPQLIRTRRLNLLDYKKADGRAAAGYWETTQTRGDGVWHAAGWASLPRKSRPGDCVVLGYSTRAGECIAFAMSDAIWPRQDVAAHFGTSGKPCEDQLWSGWSVDFARNSMPRDAVISAWVMDTDDVKFYQLNQTDRATELHNVANAAVLSRTTRD